MAKITVESINDKVALYDALVNQGMSEYNLRRDTALVDAQKSIMSGEKTIEEAEVIIEESAVIARGMLEAAGASRLPLLDEIRKDIDAFEGVLPVELVEVRQMCDKILKMALQEKAMRGSL